MGNGRRLAVPVEGTALSLLRDTRREAGRAGPLHEVARIVAIFGADGRARRDPRDHLQQTERILHFGAATRAADHGVHHEAVPIVDERAGLVREDGGRVERLAGHARIRVRHRAMRGFRPLFPVKAGAVIARVDRAIRFVICGAYALLARPRLEQRTVDGEVLAREQARLLRRRDRAGEELRRVVAVEQTLQILGERGCVPRRGLEVEPDEPTTEEIVLELLDELALASNRIQQLQL